MKKYCLVRFDDLCPTMDFEQFERAVGLMRRYGIKPLLGVIPDNKDPDQMIDKPDEDFWERIKALEGEGWTIAMHGCTHLYDQESPKTALCGRKHSEFAGNDYENQCEKIKKGKRILLSHGISTDVFFAPAHTYDKTTLKALRDNGFKYMNDGLSAKPYVEEGIKHIPCRSFGVPKNKNEGILVAVNHPSEWTRSDKAYCYDLLEEFCEKNAGFFVTFDELKQIKSGNLFFQKISERIFRIKTAVKNFLRGIIKRKG